MLFLMVLLGLWKRKVLSKNKFHGVIATRYCIGGYQRAKEHAQCGVGKQGEGGSDYTMRYLIRPYELVCSVVAMKV